MIARHAQREAQELVGDRYGARVLEPSPPAVLDGEWFADDPVAIEHGREARPVVSPVPGGDLTWPEWLADRPGHAEWVSARWLGAYRRLPEPPASLPETRLSLHRLAVYVVSPARRRANGKIALRWTLGGVGTPFFGADEQVRLAEAAIVRQRGEAAAAEPITTLARAAAFALDGPPDLAWAEDFDVPPPGDPDAPLGVDAAGTAFLGDWFGFAYSVLEELRAEPASAPASRVQLWPEHFDAAFDGLPERSGRMSFGASPGDGHVAEPYLYALSGGELEMLPLGELVAAADQRAAALAFYRERRGRPRP